LGGGGRGGGYILVDDLSDFVEFDVLFLLCEFDKQVVFEQPFDDEFDILV
jgi:hypothetical protein